MTLPRSVAEILREHVTLELECIDRMYLNVYVPALQSENGVAAFFKFHRGHRFASSALMDPISKAFVAAIDEFASRQNVPMVAFRKGERKDDVAAAHLKSFGKPEGVLFIGRAQEKTLVFRTGGVAMRRPAGLIPGWCAQRQWSTTFTATAWMRTSAPSSSSSPPTSRTPPSCASTATSTSSANSRRPGSRMSRWTTGCACTEPKRAQAICDKLSAQKIDALLRKWLRRLPHPFTAKDRAAGYRYELSIIQAEFSLTQVLDRPVTGRAFFEEVIRENLDIGRPAQVQLIFERRVLKSTPGRFRTRVITEGVTPWLYIDYKSTRIKQYHKEGCALRTETTINNTTTSTLAGGSRISPPCAARLPSQQTLARRSTPQS